MKAGGRGMVIEENGEAAARPDGHRVEVARAGYGATAGEPSGEHVAASRRRRRWLQAGAFAAAISLVVLLAASAERNLQPARTGRWALGAPIVLEGGANSADEGEGGGDGAQANARQDAGTDDKPGEKTPSEDTYCAVFSDPSECAKQRTEGRLPFWSTAAVKGELWKTMKALAELELRESAMHKEHKAKAKDQADLFDLFRQTMSQEVHDIHTIQQEMHQKHTAAFQQLVVQLSDMAKDLKSYTESNVHNVSSRIDTLQSNHDFNRQRVLKQLADKINMVNRKIEDLHRESMTAVNGTQTYAEDVESAMKAGDIRLDTMLQHIEIDFNKLDDQEKGKWANLSDALQAAEEKQESDRLVLDAKIDKDVGELRAKSSSALEAEKIEIRRQLAKAMAMINGGIVSLTQNTTERYDGIQHSVDTTIVEQKANNEEQAEQIARLRRVFEKDRDAAFARLDATDARLDKAFADLAQAKGRLETEAAADYAFLQSKLDTEVALREQEADALKVWSKAETDALRKRLDTTQSTLNSERTRLQAQRDADMLDTNLGFGRKRLAIWPAMIVKEVDDWDTAVKSQLDSDNAAIHSTLTARVHEAGVALDSIKGQMATRDTTLKAQYAGMKDLQDKNNALQQKAIDDLQRDRRLEKALSEARLDVLDGNMSSVKDRLVAIRGEITGVLSSDRVDIRRKIQQGFTDAESKLEADVSTEHTALWDKINGGVGSITSRLDALRSLVEGREARLVKFSDQISKDQRRQARSQNLEMDDIDREQHTDEREIDSTTDTLLEALGTVKAKLAAQLSRVVTERAHDDTVMREDIETQNEALRHDHHLTELHGRMTSQLDSITRELTATLKAQKEREELDFQDLVRNLTAWGAAQRAENKRQRTWLQSIADASQSAAGHIGAQTIELAHALNAADKRLTSSGTKLENDQRATANAINTSLHAELASLNQAAFAFVTRTRIGLRSKISGDMGAITSRLDSLQAASTDTQKEVQSATDAMGNKIKARQAAREAEIAGIVSKAAEDKSKMEARIDRLRQRIEMGKANIGKQFEKAAAERSTYSDNVKKFVNSYIGSSQANSSAALGQKEASMLRQLQEEVDKWSGDLKSNKEASVTESAAIDVKLKQLQETELQHRTKTNTQLMQLLSAVDSSADSADTAITSLRAGLQAQDLKLNQTVYTVTQDQQEDKERVMSLIRGSLVELRANFTAAQAAQLQSMKGTMDEASQVVDKARADVMADLLRKEGILNQSLIDVRNAQETVSSRHQAQYLAMRQEQEALKARLQSTINLVAGTVRLSTSKFDKDQHHYNALQAQDFTDLAAKLDRAITELNTDSQDARTAVEKKILKAKTQLGQAKSALSQMHAALVRETATDRVAINGEVNTRITALSDDVMSKIQTASTNLQTALNTQLANLATGVETIKSKAVSAEQELVNKMSQLEANEAAHDSAQTAKIKELQAMQQKVQMQRSKSAVDLAGNVSRIEALMYVGLNTLSRNAGTDKQAMLAQVLDAVTRAKAVLQSTITGQRAVLQAAMRQSMAEMDNSLAEEREAAAALQQELAQKIASLSAGDAASDSRWANDVNTLTDLIARLRAGAHRNNTEVHDTMAYLMNRVSADQAVVASESTGDRDEFKKISNKDSEALKVNFTLQMASEGTEVLSLFRHLDEHLEDRIRSEFQGPKDKEVDLRSKIHSLVSKIATAYSGRDAEILAINSTSGGWQNVMENKIDRFKTALRDAANAADDAKTRNFAHLDRMRVHLQPLLAEANALASLQAQIEALRSEVDVTGRQEEQDYTQTTQGNGQIAGKINSLRSDLEESLERLRNILAEETTKRTQDHVDATATLSAGQARMGRIERDIHLLDRRRLASRGRATSAPATAAAPYEDEPEAAPAPVPASSSAPSPASEPAPAPEPEPEDMPTLPPAPAPNRPALAEGQTPMPEPLPWWEYRTETSGVDYLEGKIALKDGATSGYLRGVYPLSTEGRWVVYAVMYAEQGDIDASIKVTVNGNLLGTFKNDPRSGFPCDGNKCIVNTGRYIVEGSIEGGTVEYEFQFEATQAQRPAPSIGSRMWLGPGEAAFTGVLGEQPPLLSGGSMKTTIKAINAIDGKSTARGKKSHDGHDERGYTMATEPRLTVLLGTAVMWEGTMDRGKAKLELPAPQDGAYYSCVVTQAGMMALYDRYCHVSRERTARITLGLVPVMLPGEARIVLTWGAEPKDLDIYILAPHHDPNQAPCEVSWRQKNCHSNTVLLDRDDTQGHGPETITVHKWNAGTYIIRVDEYGGNAGSPRIGGSHATVAYYSPHTGGMFSSVGSTGFIDGRVWYVMGIDGTTRASFACTPETCPVRPAPRN